MENSTQKSWYKSKTIWSALVTAAVGTLLLFGVGAGLEGEEESITEIIMQLIAVLGAIMAFVGRVMAKKDIVALLAVGVLLVAGCGGPLYTAEHRLLIDRQAALVTELNVRCQAGDDAACRDGLDAAATTLEILSEGADHE